MKKFICGFLSGAIMFSMIGAFAVSYIAESATFKVLVNGDEFNSDPPALVVDGRTYLPLRAMGDALGVPVEWNSELNQAEVGDRSFYPEVTKEENDYIRVEPLTSISDRYYKENPDIPNMGMYANKEPDSCLRDEEYILYYYEKNSNPEELVQTYCFMLEQNGFIKLSDDDNGIVYTNLSTLDIVSVMKSGDTVAAFFRIK